MADEDKLRAIEAKISALLALELDARLRQDPQSRSRPRSLDKLLSDAGLEPIEIASLLGKTPQAVHNALKRRTVRSRGSSRRKPTSRKSRTTKKAR